MNQIDSSLYFQQQGIDPLGSVGKGLQMADMIYQRNQQRQEQQKQIDIKNAYNAGTVLNPDGSVGFDQQKTLAAMAQLAKDPNSKISGHDVVSLQSQFATQAAQQAEAKQKKIQSDAAYAFQNLDPAKVKDQTSWLAAKKQAIADGHQEAAQLPDQYDPNLQQQLLDHAKRAALDTNQFVTDQRQQQTHQDSVADRGVRRQEMNSNRQTAEVDKTVAQLESIRGNPAIQQAEKDYYAAQKFNRGFNLKGDPDKLNPQVVKLLLSEAGKIATGGVPTVAELQGLSQPTIPSALASAAQALTNSPTAAKQGAFLKEIKAYNDGLLSDAKSEITGRYGRILDVADAQFSKDPRIIQARKTYMGRFDQPEQAAKPDWAE